MPKALREQEQKLNVYFENRDKTRLTKGKIGNEKTFRCWLEFFGKIPMDFHSSDPFLVCPKICVSLQHKGTTLPSIIMAVENGSLQYIFLSSRVIFHSHDGRKGTKRT